MSGYAMHREIRHIKQAADFGKVAVLYGGDSAERDVSLMSGRAIFDGLKSNDVDVHLIDLQGFDLNNLVDQNFDRVFIALHGRGGEDGSLQGALEFIGIPYTGSGVLGSALSMDKLRCKQIMFAMGISTPTWSVVNESTPKEELLATVGLPLVVKPSNEGSSIGMSIVHDENDLQRAIEKALQLDTSVIAEQFIEGKELTVSILHDQVLPIIHIETPRSFYDYEAKYFSENTAYHCPAVLTGDLTEEVQSLSITAFKAMDAFGWGRVDFMLDANNKPWCLEINTVPGMTSHSLVPMSAQAIGLSFADLVWKILESAFVREHK